MTLKSEHVGKEDARRGGLLVTFNTVSGGLIAQIIGTPTIVWSPDGGRIAFTSLAGGKSVIGVVGKDGQNLKPVINGCAGLWSLDGKQLVFRHDSDKEPVVTSIWIASADGSDTRKILDDAAEYGLNWFPDGKSIVLGSARDSKSRGEIFRINVDGSGLTKVASRERASLSSPVVVPNGNMVLFDATGPDPKSEYMGDFSIWILDLPTSHQQRITKGNHASVLW